MGESLVRDFLESAAAPSYAETQALFQALVDGQLNDIEITALLVGLKTRGETPDVLAGAAAALRRAALPFPRPDYDYADPCGTGGDGCQTLNISTAVALAAAELGLPIAKHGNRSVSSLCGSADVLEAFGIPLDTPPPRARQCLDQAGICFLFAPQYHGGLRFAMTVRRTLRTRTIFNLLGPLLNPAAPPYQVVGVYHERWCQPVAEALGRLGIRGALVVHGAGLDELALHGPTQAVYWRENRLDTLTLHPESAGVEAHPLADLAGGCPEDNARALTDLLNGQGRPAYRAAVAFNTGALLWLTGRSDSVRDGTRAVLELLQTGRTMQRLAHWREVARGPG